MDHEEFLEQRRATTRKRKLFPHSALILELRSKGYSYADVAAYLLEKKQVQVNRKSIWEHCKRADSKPGVRPPALVPRRSDDVRDTASIDRHATPVASQKPDRAGPSIESKNTYEGPSFERPRPVADVYSDAERTIAPSPAAPRSRQPTAADPVVVRGMVEINLDDPEERAAATAHAAELRRKVRESRRR